MVFLSTHSAPKLQEKLSNVKMFVRKRDGREEPVMFDKITSRIQKLCYGLNMDYIDPTSITLKVITGLYSGVSTVELDNLAAETAVMLSNEHPHYAILAARLEVSNLHKETKKTFSEVVGDLYRAGEEDGFIHLKMKENFYDIVKRNEEVLNSSIIYDRDFYYSYFAIKTLENDFLKKVNGKVVERPQHMFMRMAISIHGEDIEQVIDTYNKLSLRLYILSPTTMRNAGFRIGQILSDSCLTMKSDSIDGIFKTVNNFSKLARADLTVGLNVHCIRAKGTYIAGTNGTTNGLRAMLRVYNKKVRSNLKGRSGEWADLTIYLEPWHADVLDFLTLKKPSGKEEQRARELCYAMWIPDLFMKRVREDADWCLMSPNDSEELECLWGDAFEAQYTKFEKEGRYMKKVKARQVWDAIYESQRETGGPAMFYKDNCNSKSNQQNIGTLLSSSHNGEMMAFTSSSEAPVCPSCVICLHMFVTEKKFDFDQLKECVKSVTRTLDKMIDVTTYPLEESQTACQRQRPISIGVQGLADAFILMRYPFESEEAKLLNKQVFETIYYGAMEASCELAEKFGPYPAFEGSPVSQGILQYDMWNVTPTPLHDWASLKEKVINLGVRNSLLVACSHSPMGAIIQNCCEGTEALSSNFQNRKVVEGNIKVINHHLLNDLMELGLWDNEMETALKEGSVQDIDRIPDDLKRLYKTVWEIPQKVVLELAADRGAFIDQSQALVVRVTDPSYGKFSSMHFFAWKSGLKTGMTTFLTKTLATSYGAPSAKQVENTQKVVDSIDESNGSEENLADMVCSLDNREACLSCGS